MALEKLVQDYYGQRPHMAQDILDYARAKLGEDVPLSVAVMGAFDEFHVGQRAATEYFCKKMQFQSGARCLDVGCGIGGPARYMAYHYDLDVTGLDLTPDFISAAKSLTSELCPQASLSFDQGSALDMPYAEATFDFATMLHVGMNIQDKATLFSQVHRVLKGGAVFGVYDIMRKSDIDLNFPMPWAESQQSSFVAKKDEYVRLLQEAGFEVYEQESRQAFALESLRDVVASAKESNPKLPKFINLLAAVEQGDVFPYILMCKRT